MSHSPLAALLLALSCAPLPALADEKPRFESSVDLVYVTVAVQDAQGHPIPDLAREDFTILDGGKERPVAVFARAADEGSDERVAVDACLLVDTSGSMSTYTEQLALSALKLLNRMPRLRRACVISFDNDVRVWRAEGEPVGLVKDIMAAGRPNSATALNTALATAVEKLEGSRSRTAFLLLSDGEDVGSRVSSKDALALLQRSGVMIYPIAHGAGPSLSMPHGQGFGNWGDSQRYRGPEYLARLAEATGGTVFKPEDGTIDQVLDRIATEVSSQYVLGFAPPDPSRRGIRRLKVAVRRKDARARYRPTYVVAPRDPSPAG